VTREALAWATLVVVAARAVSFAAEDLRQGTTTAPAPPSSPAHPIERIAERTRELPPTRWTLEFDTPLLFVERVLWDTAYLSTAPARWDAPDWGRFTLFAAVTGGAFGADRTIDIESRINHPRSSSEKDFEDAVEELGSLPGIAGVVGGATIFGLAIGSDLAKSISADAGEAVLVSGLFTEIGKETKGRHRPRDGDGPFSFHPFSGNASFPSGHTTTAFALASVVSEDLDNNLWVAGRRMRSPRSSASHVRERMLTSLPTSWSAERSVRPPVEPLRTSSRNGSPASATKDLRRSRSCRECRPASRGSSFASAIDGSSAEAFFALARVAKRSRRRLNATG
jgi:membrane-associated phospholipid phosphatase